MKWLKKNEALHSIEDVVTFNTGLSASELLNPKRDPYIENLDEAVEAVKQYIAQGLNIHIVGDYDCDGVMSTTVLYLGLKEAGIEASVRFPRRFSEGYGLSMKIIDEIDDGVIITVDNGIAAVDQVAAARAKGLKVIVLDHHLRRDDNVLPDADIIVDPNALDGSEYNYYCGAGLAYRFVKKLVPDTPLMEPLLVMASIATVADVMELVGDNRNIVRDGLRAINRGNVTIGMKALLDELGTSHITEGDYGFKLGPIVNASGRLKDDGPLEVFNLIKVTSASQGLNYFAELDALTLQAKALIQTNIKRQDMVREAMVTVYRMIEENGLADKKPIILYNQVFSEGIIGILAGRIAEEYQTPAIVFTDSKTEGVAKGSGRTSGDIHLKNLLDEISDVFVGYGGHAGAAGVSVKKDRLDELETRLSKKLAGVVSTMPEPDRDTIYYDLEATVNAVPSLIKELHRFAPFGQGNPQIMFRVDNFELSPRGKDFYKLMGNLKNHIRFYGINVSAVGFDMAERYKNEGEPKKMDLVGYLSQNWYMGKSTDQIEIVDFIKKETNEKTEFFLGLESILVFQ